MVKNIRNQLNELKSDFSNRLGSLNIDVLPINGYPAIYLQHLIEHRAYYLDIYASVINISTENINRDIADIVFVDYGSGNGLMALFASNIGFKKVIAVEINSSFCTAAKSLAQAMGITTVDFINGTEYDLLHLSFHHTPVVVAGTDVIEHIYNLYEFFGNIQKLSNHVLTVFTTAANPFNERTVKKYTQFQIQDELVGRKANGDSLAGDGHLPFLDIRKQIIRTYHTALSNEDVNRLAKACRGFYKPDIESSVELFVAKGIFPKEINHPTNTCDPVTGSWSERLLSFEEYKLLYHTNGFSLSIKNGFYNTHQSNFLKKTAVLFVNTLGKFFPVLGKRFSPFITLIGKKEV